MTDNMFRRLELMQKLDVLISAARQRRFADPHEIARLRASKRRVRNQIAQALPVPVPA